MSRAILLILLLAGTARAAEPDPTRLEIGLLPALAYDSDTGFGFGAVATMARFRPGFSPYRWRLQGQLYLTLKRSPEGGLELPYHDDYLQLDFPGLLEDRLRLGLRLAFNRSRIAGYYGLGSAASVDDDRLAANPRAYQYDRTYPEIEPTARVALSRRAGKIDAVLGIRLVYNDIHAYEESKLAEDAAAGLLDGAERHMLAAASAGLLWDTRDHESVPELGMLSELTARAGAGLGADFGYGGLRASVRGFLPVWRGHLVAAARAVVDALVGRPPFYEMALGGATTLRGVRAQRYHGKVKAYANLELRATLVSFAIGDQRFAVGLLAFGDAGRVLGNGDLDAARIAVGAGGGLRLRWGEHFLVRVDFAGSPTEGTTGLYIDANHVF